VGSSGSGGHPDRPRDPVVDLAGEQLEKYLGQGAGDRRGLVGRDRQRPGVGGASSADLLVGEPRPGRTTTDRGRKVVKNRIEEIELEQGVLRDAYIARR